MIVLDANAAIAEARGTADGRALSLLMFDGEKAIAPQVFHAEAANSLWKYVRGGYMTVEEARECLSDAIERVDEFCPDEDLLVEALAEGARLDHPVYDMLYFVLARRNAATLFTLDQKLQKLCDENGVNCVYLDKEF